MSNEYKGAPIVKIVMLKGKDGDGSKLSELENDMTFLTREEIITLVNNIIDTGSVGNIDTGFVTRLKEQNKGKQLQFWVGTQAEYDELATASANTFYIITDDNFKATTAQAIEALNKRIDELDKTDVEEEISDLQTRVTNLTADVDVLGEKSETHDADIDSVTAQVDESKYHAGDVDAIQFAAGAVMEYTNGTTGKLFTFDIPLKKRITDDLALSLDNINIKAVSISTSGAAGYALGGRNSTKTFVPTDYTFRVYNTYIHVELHATLSINTMANQAPAAISGTANISISNAVSG